MLSDCLGRTVTIALCCALWCLMNVRSQHIPTGKNRGPPEHEAKLLTSDATTEYKEMGGSLFRVGVISYLGSIKMTGPSPRQRGPPASGSTGDGGAKSCSRESDASARYLGSVHLTYYGAHFRTTGSALTS